MNDDVKSVKKELEKLKQQTKIKDLFLLFAIIILVIFISFNSKENKLAKVIRVQGIIVEDDNGKERILIGAPVPFAKNRIRTDTARIKETWGKRFGKDYMKWYKDYAHHANGIILLDENGWDKVIVGDPAPDPIIGKRIGSSTGIIINDKNGLERTGYGILDVEGEDRVVLGLDKNNGSEGATLSVMPDGTVGLFLNSGKKSVFVGSANKESWYSPNQKDFLGIAIQDEDKKEKLITVIKDN